MSRIYYRGKLYDYPIKPMNALRTSARSRRCAARLSYLWVRVRPPKNQDNLEGFYVVASFGWRLYDHFFKTYNEKVWGVPASEISADWGAQRIKDMSLFARCRGAQAEAVPPVAATRRSRSRASSRSSTTRSTGPARCGRSATEMVTGGRRHSSTFDARGREHRARTTARRLRGRRRRRRRPRRTSTSART